MNELNSIVTMCDLIGGETLPGRDVALFYKDLTGQTKCLEVRSDITASALAELIAEAEGVLPGDLHLFHESSVDGSMAFPLVSSLDVSVRVDGGATYLAKKLFGQSSSKTPPPPSGAPAPTPASAPAPAPVPVPAPSPQKVPDHDGDEVTVLNFQIFEVEKAMASLHDRGYCGKGTKESARNIVLQAQAFLNNVSIDANTRADQSKILAAAEEMLRLFATMESLVLKRNEIIRIRKEIHEIRNLVADLAATPAGSLKHVILRCIIFLQLKVLPAIPDLPAGDYCDVDVEDAVNVQIPELLIKFKLVISTAQTLLRNIHSANTSGEKAALLRKLMKDIFPVDVHQLMRLVNLSKAAAKGMTGKDVVLFVGGTGVGKSTTIQFLSGCRMSREDVTVDGATIAHISAATSNAPECKTVISSPWSVSETRYINPVTFNVSRVCAGMGFDEGATVTLCDAPGFGDTAGPEVDIANGLGIFEAMNLCSNVKLVVLHSYKDLGDRNGGILSLISTVLGMVSGITQKDKKRLNHVHFLYTKYPSLAEVTGALASIRLRVRGEVTEALAETVPTLWVLDDMIEKARSKISTVDPLVDKADLLLKQLIDSGDGMPGSALKFSMSTESKMAVAREVIRELEILKAAMDEKEIDLVLHHLNNLRQLSLLTKLPEASDAHKSAVDHLVKHIADYCKNTATAFVKQIRSKDGVGEADFNAYKAAVQFLQDVQVLREDHLRDALMHPSALTSAVTLALVELRREIINGLPIVDPKVKIYLDNLQLIKSTFKDFALQYDEDVSLIIKKLTASDDPFENALAIATRVHADEAARKEAFVAVAVICQSVFHAIANLAPHVDAKPHFDAKVKKVLDTIVELNASVSDVLNDQRLTDESVEKLKSVVSIVSCAKQSNKLQDIVDTYRKGNAAQKKGVDELYCDIVAQIMDWYTRYADEAERLCKMDNPQLFNIKRALDSMTLLRKIPDIYNRTGSSFFMITQLINGIVKAVQEDMENLILSAGQMADGTASSTMYRRIHRSLNRLQENKAWIAAYLHGGQPCEEVFANVGAELKRHVDNLVRGLRFLNLGWKKPENVTKAFVILNEIDQISVMASLLPGLQDHINSIVAAVVNRIQVEFARIIHQFSLPEFQNERNMEELLRLKTLEREFDHLDPVTVYLRAKGFSSLKDVDEYIAEKSAEKQECMLQLETDKLNAEKEKSALKAEDGDSVQMAKIRTLNATIADCDAALSDMDVKFAGLFEMLKVKDECAAIRAKSVPCSKDQLDLLIEGGFASMIDLQVRMQQLLPGQGVDVAYNEASFQLVDPALANVSLEYLDACTASTDTQTADRATDISHALTRFLDAYGVHLNDTITSAVDSIRNSSDGDLLVHSSRLNKSLQKFVDMQPYSRVHDAVSGSAKMKGYGDTFTLLLQQLSINMQGPRAVMDNDLMRDIDIARALIVVDKYFPSFFVAPNSFSDLFNIHRHAMIAGVDQHFQQVMKCIHDGDTNLLSSILQASPKLPPGHLNQVVTELPRCLHKMATDALSTVRIWQGKFEREESYGSLEQIKKQVDQIENAIVKLHVVKVLSEDVSVAGTEYQLLSDVDVAQLQQSVDDIKAALQRGINTALATVVFTLDLYSFDLAKRNLENIDNVCSLLKNTVTQAILDIKEGLNKRLSEAILKISQGDEFSDITKYSARPPKDVLEKLNVVNRQGGDSNYMLAYNKLVEKVKDSLNAAVSKVQNAGPRFSIEEKLLEMEKIKLALSYVPEDMKNSIGNDVDEQRNRLIEQQDADKKTVESFIQTSVSQSDDLNQMMLILQLQETVRQFVRRGSIRQLNILVEHVYTKLRNYQYKIVAVCNKGTGSIEDALVLMKNLFKYKEAITAEYDNPQVRQIYEQVVEILGKTFRACCDVVMDMQKATNIAKVEMAFSNMMRCLTYCNEFDAKIEIEVLLPKEEDCKKCKDALTAVSATLSGLSNPVSAEVAFDQLDVAIVSNHATNLQRWAGIIGLIQVEYQTDTFSVAAGYVSDIASLMRTLRKRAADDVPSVATVVGSIKLKIETATARFEEMAFLRRDIVHDERALNEHFGGIVGHLQKLHALHVGFSFVDPSTLDFAAVVKQWEKAVVGKLKKAGNDLIAVAKKIGNVSALIRVRPDCEEFVAVHNNIVTFSEVNKMGIDGHSVISMCDISPVIADAQRLVMAKVQGFEQEINAYLRKDVNELAASPDVDAIANRLMFIKFIACELVMYTAMIVPIIDALLTRFRAARKVHGLAALSNVLSEHAEGQRLIAEHNVLAGEKLRLQNDGMKEQNNLQYVVDGMRGDNMDWEVLRSRHAKFSQLYDQVVQQCITRSEGVMENIPLNDLIVRMNGIVRGIDCSDLLADKTTLQWTSDIKDKLADLLAIICALWTLMKSEHYYQARGMSNCDMYLIKPQATQVIAMFRMLGIGYAAADTAPHVPGNDLSADESNAMVVASAECVKSEGVASGVLAGLSSAVSTIKKAAQRRIFGGEKAAAVADHVLIENNLIQLGTGEGKSVVLAICASVFALLGLEVNISCYSEYLTERDKSQFADLFKKMGIEKRIEYGTFNKLCENLLNSQVNVRDAVLDMMLNNRATLPMPSGKGGSTVPKILLIDEVDVFISDKFFGQDYLPSVTIHDNTVNVFLDELWALSKKQKINTMDAVRSLLKSPYDALMCRFGNFTKLIEEAIKDLVAALSSFRSSTWYVLNDKICYEYGESIVDTVHLGPDTVWAYYEEHDKLAISDESLRENVGILIKCGKFSYAEMPKEFAFISGATGTLETLSATDRDILSSIYSITKNTYMPSVYGGNKRKFTEKDDHDVFILNSEKFFPRIREEIDLMRNAGRPLLIFFPTKESLNLFYNSAAMADLRLGELLQITEETKVSMRQSLIDKSTAGAKVTLLTRTFGRGTDFICKNPQVKANGGVCVIQTFFSEEYSEEVQIMGRCARQGEPGSFRIMLLDSELEYFLGSGWAKDIAPIIESKKCYETLHNRRSLMYATKCSGKKTRIDELKNHHEASVDFMQSIITSNMIKCKEFLESLNVGANVGAGFSRTLLLLDATGSMGGMLSVAKDCVCTVFERASATLKQGGLPPDNFKVQFAVYRDYDCGVDEILRTSAWHTDPSNLRAFMDKIKAYGGGDWQEAIEIGLWHANQEASSEDGLSQVILIGDAPAKDQAAIADYRRFYGGGEGVWAGSRFGPATHFKAEATKLRVKNIPIHAFFLTREEVEENFKAIAGTNEPIDAALKGRCEFLNIMDPDSTDQFTHFVTEEVLRMTARDKGNETVELYKKKYGVTHTA